MQQSKTKIPAKKLTFFGFLAMTISMVVSLYEYPTFATSGFSLVFFLLLGGFAMVYPCGIVRSRDGNGERMGKRRCLYLGQSHIGKTIRFCRNLFPMV